MSVLEKQLSPEKIAFIEHGLQTNFPDGVPDCTYHVGTPLASIFLLNTAYYVQDLLADRLAFRAAVAEQIAGLLPPEPTLNSQCADDWEMGRAEVQAAQRLAVQKAATRLGLTLP